MDLKLATVVLFVCLVFSIEACNAGHENLGDGKNIVLSADDYTSVPVDTTQWNLCPVDTSIEYVTGQFEPATDTVFTLIDREKADRSGLYLRKDTYRAFLLMDSAAREEGISLQIRSATRNFDYQKGIWERKWTGETSIENGERLNETTPDAAARASKILRYSSMPGTSRHHWGTDIDLNNFTNRYFEHGEGLRIYSWLQENAAKYGFRQPYTEKGELRPYGYNEEKWHWSFYPVSDILTKYAKAHLKDSMISGFPGSETAAELQVVEKYVLGLNPELLPHNK